MIVFIRHCLALSCLSFVFQASFRILEQHTTFGITLLIELPVDPAAVAVASAIAAHVAATGTSNSTCCKRHFDPVLYSLNIC